MLSLFPTLLAYERLSPLLIRLTLGIILIYWAYKGLRDAKQTSGKKALDIVEGLVGILLIIGLWTQAAAALAALGFLVCLIGKIRDKAFLTGGVNYVLILFILSLSLMLTGAGFWAFDLPL